MQLDIALGLVHAAGYYRKQRTNVLLSGNAGVVVQNEQLLPRSRQCYVYQVHVLRDEELLVVLLLIHHLVH